MGGPPKNLTIWPRFSSHYRALISGLVFIAGTCWPVFCPLLPTGAWETLSVGECKRQTKSFSLPGQSRNPVSIARGDGQAPLTPLGPVGALLDLPLGSGLGPSSSRAEKTIWQNCGVLLKTPGPTILPTLAGNPRGCWRKPLVPGYGLGFSIPTQGFD